MSTGFFLIYQNRGWCSKRSSCTASFLVFYVLHCKARVSFAFRNEKSESTLSIMIWADGKSLQSTFRTFSQNNVFQFVPGISSILNALEPHGTSTMMYSILILIFDIVCLESFSTWLETYHLHLNMDEIFTFPGGRSQTLSARLTHDCYTSSVKGQSSLPSFQRAMFCIHKLESPDRSAKCILLMTICRKLVKIKQPGKLKEHILLFYINGYLTVANT